MSKWVYIWSLQRDETVQTNLRGKSKGLWKPLKTTKCQRAERRGSVLLMPDLLKKSRCIQSELKRENASRITLLNTKLITVHIRNVNLTMILRSEWNQRKLPNHMRPPVFSESISAYLQLVENIMLTFDCLIWYLCFICDLLNLCSFADYVIYIHILPYLLKEFTSKGRVSGLFSR